MAAKDLSSQHTAHIIASESTYGTDAVDTILQDDAQDIIYPELGGDFEPETPDMEAVEAERARPARGGDKHGMIQTTVPVSGMVPLVERRTDEDHPDYDPIFRAANLAPTVDTDTVTYDAVVPNQEAMTLYHYRRMLESDDWRFLRTTGVRGNIVFSFEWGSEASFTFDGHGLWDAQLSATDEYFDPTDGSLALDKDGTSVAARATGEEVMVDQPMLVATELAVTIDGETFPLSSLEIDLGMEATPKEAYTGSTAVPKVALMESSRVGGSFSFVEGDTAFEAAQTAYEDATEVTLSAVLTGGTDTFTFSSDFLQILSFDHEDADGYLGHSVEYALNSDWANLANASPLSIEIKPTP